MKARRETVLAQEALVAAQAAHAKFAQDLAIREAARAAEEHLATFEYSKDDLPQTIATPDGQQWQELHFLWASLAELQRQETTNGVKIPITFAQLRAGTAVPELVLGPALWRKAFPAGKPSEDALVTVQVRELLKLSLEAHQDKLCAEQAKQKEAKDAAMRDMTAVVDRFVAKRPRTEDPLAATAGG